MKFVKPMKTVSSRLSGEIMAQLEEIDSRPTISAQAAIEVFVYLRRSTLHELRGRFSREEIIALADSFNGLTPTWQVMCNTAVLVAHTEDAEKYKSLATSNGADPLVLIEKIKQLTSAQASVLQLELWAFWNRNDNAKPDIEVLIKSLS